MRDDMSLTFGFDKEEVLEALVDYVNKHKSFSLQKELCEVRLSDRDDNHEFLLIQQSSNTISATKYFQQGFTN